MKRYLFELDMARRLGWKLPGARRVTPAVGVAVAGVALSVMVMLLSVAIVQGFKMEVERNILDIDDAITITGYDDEDRPVPFPLDEISDNLTLPPGVTLAGRMQLAGILKTSEDFLGITLNSDDAIRSDTIVALSRTQADMLQLQKGDAVPVYFFIDNRLRLRQLTVDSIYCTGIAEHDRAAAFCSPELLRSLLSLSDGYVQTAAVRGCSASETEDLAQDLHQQLLGAYYLGRLNNAYGLTDIFQTEGQYFAWLNLLDTNVVVILALMAAVAVITLTSSLFVIILERVTTIGLLKALGATNRQIGRIFVLMAERLVLRGLLWGNVIALTLILLQHYTHMIPLDPASYYVDHVPAHFSLLSFLLVNIGVVAVSYCILTLPALIVSRISPVSALRYE